MKALYGMIFALIVSGCAVYDEVTEEIKEECVSCNDDGPGGDLNSKWQRIKYTTDTGVKKSVGVCPGCLTMPAGEKMVGCAIGIPIVNVALLFLPTIPTLFVTPFCEPDESPGKGISCLGLIGVYRWRDHAPNSKRDVLEEEVVLPSNDLLYEGAGCKKLAGAYLSFPGYGQLKKDVEAGGQPRVVFEYPLSDAGDAGQSTISVREYKKAKHVPDALAFVDKEVSDKELVDLYKYRADCRALKESFERARDRAKDLGKDFKEECAHEIGVIEVAVKELETATYAFAVNTTWLRKRQGEIKEIETHLDALDEKRLQRREQERIAEAKRQERMRRLEEEAKKVARADLRKRRGDFKGVFGRCFGEVVDVDDGELVKDKQGRHFYRVPFVPKKSGVFAKYYLWALVKSHRVCGIEGRMVTALDSPENGQPDFIKALEERYGEKFNGRGDMDDGYWELEFPEEKCVLSVISSGKNGAGARIFSTLAMAAIFGTRGAVGEGIANAQAESEPKIKVADFMFSDEDKRIGTVAIAIDKTLLGLSESEYASRQSDKKKQATRRVIESF